MAQFRIKTSKNEVLCPSKMEKHEKKSLFDKCKDEKLKLFAIVMGLVNIKCVMEIGQYIHVVKENKQNTRIGARNRKYT